MASLDSTLFGLKQGKTKLFWDEGEAEIKKKLKKKKRSGCTEVINVVRV